MKMFIIRVYSAGMLIFQNKIQEEDLADFLSDTEEDLFAGNLKMAFGYGALCATELCVDIYDAATMKYRMDLAASIKRS